MGFAVGDFGHGVIYDIEGYGFTLHFANGFAKVVGVYQDGPRDGIGDYIAFPDHVRDSRLDRYRTVGSGDFQSFFV